MSPLKNYLINQMISNRLKVLKYNKERLNEIIDGLQYYFKKKFPLQEEERYLQNSIEENPHDINIRAIYADWLEESGQPALARFYRLGLMPDNRYQYQFEIVDETKHKSLDDFEFNEPYISRYAIKNPLDFDLTYTDSLKGRIANMNLVHYSQNNPTKFYHHQISGKPEDIEPLYQEFLNEQISKEGHEE